MAAAPRGNPTKNRPSAKPAAWDAETGEPIYGPIPKGRKVRMSFGELKIRYRRREGDDAWGGGE